MKNRRNEINMSFEVSHSEFKSTRLAKDGYTPIVLELVKVRKHTTIE